MPEEENSTNRERPAQPNAILRYSGMAMQMMAIIVAGALGGIWLDGHFKNTTSWFTGGLTILSVIVAMYTAVKDLLGGETSKKKNSK
jgi:ATP synthase protein I